MSELPEHVRRNRAMWDDWAKKYATAGERAWAQKDAHVGNLGRRRIRTADVAG